MFSGMWDLLDMDLESFEEDNMEDFDEEGVLTYVADKEDELILDEEKVILLQNLILGG